ncbi:hypothetical protein PG910_07605 [Tenacibaculum dicentrarchi]|nr:hypothetical protein PG910_07370 [Tenacibaculum dicentrarchi]WBX67990.1 hypothetical protein PG910_07605 [Tenacibaculum dicentrarchi]
MKKKYLIIVIALSCIISCNIEDKFLGKDAYDCNQLSDYVLSDTIKYINETDTIHFNVTNIYSHEVDGYKYCGISQGYETNEQLGYKIKERTFGSNNFEGWKQYAQISMTSKPSLETFFKFNLEENDENTAKDFTIEYLTNYLHMENEYNNVIIVSKDTVNGNPNISRIVRAIPGGIIEFYDFHKKKKWTLIK